MAWEHRKNINNPPAASERKNVPHSFLRIPSPTRGLAQVEKAADCINKVREDVVRFLICLNLRKHDFFGISLLKKTSLPRPAERLSCLYNQWVAYTDAICRVSVDKMCLPNEIYKAIQCHWSWPELAILGADQKERELWEREWMVPGAQCKLAHAYYVFP